MVKLQRDLLHSSTLEIQRSVVVRTKTVHSATPPVGQCKTHTRRETKLTYNSRHDGREACHGRPEVVRTAVDADRRSPPGIRIVSRDESVASGGTERLLNAKEHLRYRASCKTDTVFVFFARRTVSQVFLGIGQAFSAPACDALVARYFPDS